VKAVIMRRFENPDQIIHASPGERFAVVLKGNPTTGYTWQVSPDERYLELVDQRFEPKGQGVGAGGQEIFTFRTLSTGHATITCEYRRPWDQTARDTVSFNVQIP
jgi:predicted secreted protein